ncbi:hypothetical protein HN51_030829 [Arachis hypogaea]
MEAKMFGLKEQVADHAKVVAKLEATKAKVELLQKKLKHEAEYNREQIIILQQRILANAVLEEPKSLFVILGNLPKCNKPLQASVHVVTKGTLWALRILGGHFDLNKL